MNYEWDYFHFEPLDPPHAAPDISNCLVNDVGTGFYFDNEASPTLTDCSVISAETAYSCWGFSSPRLINCNAAELTGAEPKAMYGT